MPTKRKETRLEEPVFVDEEGSYVHEAQCARYTGGIRRYISAAAAAAVGQEATGATAATAGGGARTASAKGAGGGKSAAGRRDRAAAAAADDDAAGNGACLAVFRHGMGTFTSPRLRYCGGWVEDAMEGEGCLEFLQSGSRYRGTFLQGRFEGRGVYTWADGSAYDGAWRCSRIHGEGVYTDASGTVWRGQYYNGTGPGLEQVYHNAATAAGIAAEQ